MGRSVSSPESDSSSSQESATGCFFLNADADLETCGFMESLLREDSSSFGAADILNYERSGKLIAIDLTVV